jgi:hypothetical protein
MQEYTFRLHENPEFGWSPRLSSKDFIALLANVTAVRIRGAYVPMGSGELDEVRLGTAVRGGGGGGKDATWIERCDCPAGYQGQFCQLCQEGYHHENNGGPFARCIECRCNNHADSCDQESGKSTRRPLGQAGVSQTDNELSQGNATAATLLTATTARCAPRATTATPWPAPLATATRAPVPTAEPASRSRGTQRGSHIAMPDFTPFNSVPRPTVRSARSAPRAARGPAARSARTASSATPWGAWAPSSPASAATATTTWTPAPSATATAPRASVCAASTTRPDSTASPASRASSATRWRSRSRATRPAANPASATQSVMEILHRKDPWMTFPFPF